VGFLSLVKKQKPRVVPKEFSVRNITNTITLIFNL
jgi:hypothetical protein